MSGLMCVATRRLQCGIVRVFHGAINLCEVTNAIERSFRALLLFKHLEPHPLLEQHCHPTYYEKFHCCGNHE